MTVYLIIFWILGMIAILMELRLTRKARLTLYIVSYVLLVLFVGLRWQTGNDWTNYYEYYVNLSSLHDNSGTFEIGYRIFSLGIRSLGLPYAGFNVIYALVYLGLMFLSFRHDKYRVSGWIVLQLFAPFILGLMGTTRQAMAVSICMFSVRYLLSRDWRRFLLLVAIATTFHVSALAFLMAWPLPAIRLTVRRVCVVLGIVIFASLFNVGTAIFNFAEQRVAILRLADLESKLQLEQASNPEEFQNAGGAMTTVIRAGSRVAQLALFIFLFRFYTEESDQLYLKLYLLNLIIVVTLSGAVYVLAERVAIYFAIFQMHLMAAPIQRIRMPAIRQLYCATLILLSLARLSTGLYLVRPKVFVPYKGVYINQDVRRDPGWF